MARIVHSIARFAAALGLALAALSAGTAAHAQEEDFDVPLSAQVDRLEGMMKDCTDDDKGGMTQVQCSCLFREAWDKDISNVDVGYYVGGRDQWSNISSNDVKMDLAGLQIDCLGESTTAFYDQTVADYKKRLKEHEEARSRASSGAGSTAGASELEPLDPPAQYSAHTRQDSLETCPIIYWREASYCACVVEKSERYLPLHVFQPLFTRLGPAYSSLDPRQIAKFNEIRNACEAAYTGHVITTDERDEALENYVKPKVRTYEPAYSGQ